MSKDKENNLHWYQKTSSIILVGFIVLVISISVAFGLLTLNFWWQIKNGEGDILYQRIFGLEQTQLKINRSSIETTDDPYLGNVNADIIIVEFIDYKCPICKEFSKVLYKINSNYGDRVKIIIRDFPIESIHLGASKLAYFVNCAYEQDKDKFLKAHDLLFFEQDKLPNDITDDYLLGLGDRIKLDNIKLKSCLKNNETVFEVMEDFDDAIKYGVQGTPTFFINGEMVEGVVSWDAWKSFLDKLFPEDSLGN